MIKKIILVFLFISLTVQFTACTWKYWPAVSPERKEYNRLIEQARTEIDERHHMRAIATLDAAGRILPDRPEWLHEKSKALFSMDRFQESALFSMLALERGPDLYDAMPIGWAARLEAEKSSEEARSAVRAEISALLEDSDDIGALFAAFEGYSCLKDEPAEQQVILKLAEMADFEAPDVRNGISQNLFEQIIQAGDPSEKAIKIKMMEAFVAHFPEHRLVDDVTFRLLTDKQPVKPDKSFNVDAFLQSNVPAPEGITSRRIKTGAARWLIEQNKLPEKAIQLLQESLAPAARATEERPPHFTEALWKAEREEENDQIHYLLGRAWFNAGKYAEAEKEFGYVAGKKRHWSGVYHYLGLIARQKKDPKLAISWFQRALVIEPREDSDKALRELLSQHKGYRGEPSRYFIGESNGIDFSDMTDKAGLKGIKASRVAWGDYDGDGFADLLLDGRLLFRNTGKGGFAGATGTAGLDAVKDSNGGVWGDYDNDGDLDIFMTSHNGNRLFKNDGNGKFIDVTSKSFVKADPRPTEAAAWGDLDNDGYLDLYTANYERPGVTRGIGAHDRLFRNSRRGTFVDISRPSGIKPDEAMCGRGVTWTDINADGRQEIVVANYRLDPNFLWMNGGGGVLVDKAEEFGIRGTMVAGAFGHSIGPVSGDLDNDGLPDLFISNLAHPRYIEFSDLNMMLKNQGPPEYSFKDRFSDSGIPFEETNSDPALADVDNDGDLDLYITAIYPGRFSHLFLNDGKGHFTDVSWQTGARVENGWGAAFADYDNDGFVDLLVASKDGVRLFRNNGNGNHWLKVNIRDKGCNRFGIGSKVTVEAAGKRQVREITAGRGTGSQDESTLTFGLGRHTGPVSVLADTLCGDFIEIVVKSPDQTVTLKNGK